MAESTRMAIVHEWVQSRAGSEKVFEALAGIFPEADLFALTREPDVELDLGGRHVSTTFLDRMPELRVRRSLTLPLMPLAWKRLRRDPYDLVITSSHAFARWFPPAREALHLSYVHAPARYLWTPELDNRGPASRRLAKATGGPLRRLDRRSIDWVDSLAANSTAVADRILRFYDRQARVIHPPVDTQQYRRRDTPKAGYALCVSRFIPYKRIDVAIAACARVGKPLVVAGHGPGEKRLMAQARGTATTFVVDPDDDELSQLYAAADVLIYPGEEDFGIVPVEAQACGTPVLAYGRGGSRDTVIHGETGVLVDRQDAESFAAALIRTDWSTFDTARLTAHAGHFGLDRFEAEVLAWLEDARSVSGAGRSGRSPSP